jgi:adenylosuccinate lyase
MDTPITALDGRYKKYVTELAPITSEFGLMKYRVRMEIAWLMFLQEKEIMPADISLSGLAAIRDHFKEEHFAAMKEYEKTTNHDIKAVEYFLRDQITEAAWPWIHFACTSEDVNNIAYALMLRDARELVVSYLTERIVIDLATKAHEWKAVPMLSRTHGQPATPTTMGKEMAVYVHRLRTLTSYLTSVPITAKVNGASGNYAAHTAAFPNINWADYSRDFIESLGLVWNPLTTQIESHDMQAATLNYLGQLCGVIVDLCSDMWGYISMGYFGQATKNGEVGSSTMPHKVIPIDFENARGNAKMARGTARTLADELVVSTWQRDLSDSTLQRNFGAVFGFFLVALKNLEKGLGKIELNRNALTADLEANPEVLTEAIQVVLRKNGLADAYEQLKTLARGSRLTRGEIQTFIKDLDIADEDRQTLLSLTPAAYIGLSQKLVEDYVDE